MVRFLTSETRVCEGAHKPGLGPKMPSNAGFSRPYLSLAA